MQEEISLKSRKILPILLSVMATFGITTAVSVTASAAEVTKSPYSINRLHSQVLQLQKSQRRKVFTKV